MVSHFFLCLLASSYFIMFHPFLHAHPRDDGCGRTARCCSENWWEWITTPAFIREVMNYELTITANINIGCLLATSHRSWMIKILCLGKERPVPKRRLCDHQKRMIEYWPWPICGGLIVAPMFDGCLAVFFWFYNVLYPILYLHMRLGIVITSSSIQFPSQDHRCKTYEMVYFLPHLAQPKRSGDPRCQPSHQCRQRAAGFVKEIPPDLFTVRRSVKTCKDITETLWFEKCLGFFVEVVSCSL